MTVIPFYGTEHPELFALERQAMDRPGRVVRALGARLPSAGNVLDVGAGDGFVANLLTTRRRRVVPLEPAAEMIRWRWKLPWVRGDAEALPFRTGAFAGGYATWAYFFSREWDPSPGLAELHRSFARAVRCSSSTTSARMSSPRWRRKTSLLIRRSGRRVGSA